MSIKVRRRPGRPSGGSHVVDRDDLLDAAERVIRRDGPRASLEAIAVEAGVTKPVVYARVGGKADLANALAIRLGDRLTTAAGKALRGRPTGRPTLAAFIEATLVTVADHRELFLYVTSGNADDTPQHRLYLAERSAAPMAAQLAAWRTAAGRDPAVAEPWAYGVIGMLHFVSLWWLHDPSRPARQLADELAELLWSGLADD
jgi:AcrR family transcriptional regulator